MFEPNLLSPLGVPFSRLHAPTSPRGVGAEISGMTIWRGLQNTPSFVEEPVMDLPPATASSRSVRGASSSSTPERGRDDPPGKRDFVVSADEKTPSGRGYVATLAAGVRAHRCVGFEVRPDGALSMSPPPTCSGPRCSGAARRRPGSSLSAGSSIR